MKPKNLFLSIAVAVVLALVLTAGTLVTYNTTRMLPNHTGLAYETGLAGPVEILRDEYGIPHIYASSVEDLFFAQGYVHAQDRWWQMELERHTGLGEIGELTGFNPSVVASDLFIRTAGWNRSTAADLEVLGEESRTALEAYAAGVNAYTGGKHGGALALEYTLLGLTGVQIEVEPWEPLDSLAWVKVMAWGQSSNWDDEITRMDLIEDIGAELTQFYIPDYPFDHRPTIVTESDLPLTENATAASVTNDSAAVLAGLVMDTSIAGGISPYFAPLISETGVGSNSWVISGSNTESGHPILANDPHLGIQMPSIWYEIGLHCRPVSETCPYDVVGFSLPGIPTILIGHNQRIAWGLTNAIADIQDVYLLRINPDNPLQYEYNGEWRDMEVVTEVIDIGTYPSDREDDPATDACENIANLPLNSEGKLEIQVRLTHFGPIISDNSIEDCTFIAQNNDDTPMALRWTAFDPHDLIASTLMLNRAGDWNTFQEAMRNWYWPSINFVYADVEGNIGYQLPFNVPIRAVGHDGTLPVPGWTGDYEWQGYIPYEYLPHIENPDRGWIVTANHGVVPETAYASQLAAALGDDATYLISKVYAFGYRGQRIVEMVSATRGHTVDTVAEMQGDNHSVHAEELLPYLFDIEFDDDRLNEAVDWLKQWDLQTYMDSPQAALFAAFWTSLVEHLWSDQLGFMPGGGGHLAWGTQLLLNQPDHEWWDNPETSDIENRADIMARALTTALDAMEERFGSDRDKWRWGDMHTATFVNNPMGVSGIGLVENLFNGGPARASGSWDTVNRTPYSVNSPYEVRGSITSMRMIVDLGDLENSQSINTTGQSGHPFSGHYTDLIDMWRTIKYHPMLFGPDAVEDGVQARFELRPAPDTGRTEAN